jgi:hypothetical protein
MPVIFVVVFGVVWVVVAEAIARPFRWSRVSRAYPFTGKIPRERYWVHSLWTRRGGCYEYVRIGVDQKGIYFDLLFRLGLFRSWHPPIFVPWEEVSIADSRVFLTPVLELTFRRVPEVPFQLPKSLFSRDLISSVRQHSPDTSSLQP